MSMTKEAIEKMKLQMGWTCSVYRLTFPDGMIYVGQTSRDVHERWQGGSAYRECGAIFDAIMWFGWRNIKKEVLYTGLSRLQAYYYERKTIEEMCSAEKDKGFNKNSGRRYGDMEMVFVLSDGKSQEAAVYTIYVDADDVGSYDGLCFVKCGRRFYKGGMIDRFIYFGALTKEKPDMALALVG